MAQKFEGKIALLTGARGGTGRAIPDRFLREGATVYGADPGEGGSLGPTGRLLFLAAGQSDSAARAVVLTDQRRPSRCRPACGYQSDSDLFQPPGQSAYGAAPLGLGPARDHCYDRLAESRPA